MLTIRITDLPKRQSQTETFLDGSLTVISRSGLNMTESLLLENLPRLGTAPASLLVAGNRTGAAAMAAATLFPGCAAACHAFDLHHARAIQRNLAANGLPARLILDPFLEARGPAPANDCPLPTADSQLPTADSQLPTADCLLPTVYCTASIPPGPYAAALFMATPGTMTGELVLDQLEDIHRNLADGGICLLACEAERGPLFKQLRAIFGNHSVLFDKKGVSCVLARKRGPLVRTRDFSAAFPASLPGLAPCELVSLPGVFCHRRPDAGGLALAEVAARDLKPGQRVLDMGCGCGLVGILLARSQPDVRVTFVDSHARALAATRRNLEALGLLDRSDLILSDTGEVLKCERSKVLKCERDEAVKSETETHSSTSELQNFRTLELPFDLFAGNPPYYSDFRIADLFLRTAHDALAPGGVCLTVAKTARALRERQAALFGQAEIVPRRGYGVVRSVRC